MHWQPISPQRYTLAEGPLWDTPSQTLYWVDIAGRLACRLGPKGLEQWPMPEPVSAFIPTTAGDALVTLASGVYRLRLDQPEPQHVLFAQPDPTPGNRANEARCDQQGRLWLGTMQNNLAADGSDIPVTRRSGGLFRIHSSGEATRLLEGQGIVNTLLWSPDGQWLYSADSHDGELRRYRLLAGGGLGAAEPWAEAGPGSPDGSAMDEQGYVWNARWGGGCLLRFAPDGRIDRRIELPLSHPTSCVFGGPAREYLYVTTARPAGAVGEWSGAVLCADVGIAGLPCERFAG
ncbi:SMP-30/gluconolactonase/LRE family protein [Pseudomonas typographi]|uniref:SMP-30/gluconolactonase/LRE family protein n=1 Tax=Pseudomonas typographi TaxID=2715964 RepID=UPI001681D760|nr:SMP-30/gluconolactonase/LRE family protein [Pseudomonas typographi]MBD1588816.1 SMP-30/gluconolactonase/LRE family protein [Pseudomonas typographi]